MRKIILAFLIVFLFASITKAQTIGTLTITTTTSAATTGASPENWNPKNILAIWIEDNQGNFIKTLMAYTQNTNYMKYLTQWKASTTAFGTPYSRPTDAITGATRSSHAVRSCTWNGKNTAGATIPDGTYRIRMELTDRNSTGNYSTFTFVKSSLPQTLTPTNVASFGSITITWVPTINDIDEIELNNLTGIYPNPSNGKFNIVGNGNYETEIYDLNGKLVLKTNDKTFDLSENKNGIYLAILKYDTKQIIKKIVIAK